MTYMLRDRPDGQVEVVILRPAVVGILTDRDLAERFVAFLKCEEPELVEEAPASFATAAADVAEAEAGVVEEIAAVAEPVFRHLPAVIDLPQAPKTLPVVRPKLSEAQLDRAFARIGGGEKLGAVALALGVPMGQMRGAWAQHRRRMQEYLAKGGQQSCTLCGKAFTPSISSPDKCARCAHD